MTVHFKIVWHKSLSTFSFNTFICNKTLTFDGGIPYIYRFSFPLLNGINNVSIHLSLCFFSFKSFLHSNFFSTTSDSKLVAVCVANCHNRLLPLSIGLVVSLSAVFQHLKKLFCSFIFDFKLYAIKDILYLHNHIKNLGHPSFILESLPVFEYSTRYRVGCGSCNLHIIGEAN